MSTEHTTPPMKASEESTRDQLVLARKQGEAYAQALEAMHQESGADIERAGEYEIGIVVEDAEGMYHLEGEGNLVWKEPTSENAHIEVAVGSHQQPFIWHPWLYHYGLNWEVPGEGNYKIRVRIDAPLFMRHDHENGKRYANTVEVEFDRHIKPGQKRAT